MVTLLESFIQGRPKQGLSEIYDNYKEEIKRKFGDYVYQHSGSTAVHAALVDPFLTYEGILHMLNVCAAALDQ